MLELRAGCTASEVMEALSSAEASIEHTLSKLGGKPQNSRWLSAYFAWVEYAASALGKVLSPEVVTDLIYTQSYWVIRQSDADSPWVLVKGFVDVEFAARRKNLAEIRHDLGRELARWEDYPAQLIVPDTNIFLREGISLEEINWKRW
jgi:hypothetical protein